MCLYGRNNQHVLPARHRLGTSYKIRLAVYNNCNKSNKCNRYNRCNRLISVIGAIGVICARFVISVGSLLPVCNLTYVRYGQF